MDMDERLCSFCNKPAAALIKAPNATAPKTTAPNAAAAKGRGEVYICTECVRACAAILDSDDGDALLAIGKETVQ